MTKYVELVVEDLRTRVRFPPTPPIKASIKRLHQNLSLILRKGFVVFKDQKYDQAVSQLHDAHTFFYRELLNS